jgi:hypothetical protein
MANVRACNMSILATTSTIYECANRIRIQALSLSILNLKLARFKTDLLLRNKKGAERNVFASS